MIGFPKPAPGSGRLERRKRKAERAIVTKREERQTLLAEREAYQLLKMQVYVRDGGVDRAFGHVLTFDEAHMHHIVYRSHGGTDTTDNLVILSPETHDLVHQKGTLTITGDADTTLYFTLKDLKGQIVRTWESSI